MTVLHPALDAALGQDGVTIFGALKIELPDATIRLLDGSAEIDIDGETYAGDDPTYGTWESIEDFEDGTGDEAPRLSITLLPASDSAAFKLSDPGIQGAQISASIGVRDNATGLPVGEPYRFFYGEIDVPVHKIGRGESKIEYDCVGGMERMFFNDEGIRLAQSWHEQVWPGELGFSHVTGIADIDYWGMDR